MKEITASKWVLIKHPKDQSYIGGQGVTVNSWDSYLTEDTIFEAAKRDCTDPEYKYVICKVIGGFVFDITPTVPLPPPTKGWTPVKA